MKALELFSGIGGMHCAIGVSGVPVEVVAAADINTIANKVYRHNFKDTPLLEKNIQSLSPELLNELGTEIILMSPPCQPFTRVGLKKDLSDNRTTALSHIIAILPQMDQKCQYILLENVRGFESSETRALLLETLDNCGFLYQEFIISPFQFGIPNSRERYYLIAKRKPFSFTFQVQPEPMTSIPTQSTKFQTEEFGYSIPRFIKDVVEVQDTDIEKYDSYLVPEKELKRAWIMDVVTKNSDRSCCFTKAYSHYAEGTGSVYSPLSENVVKSTIEHGKKLQKDSLEYTESMKQLKLRYLTPKEILRLMCFPEKFGFPEGITRRQKYRLIGNSINVAIVSKLIKILISGDNNENNR